MKSLLVFPGIIKARLIITSPEWRIGAGYACNPFIVCQLLFEQRKYFLLISFLCVNHYDIFLVESWVFRLHIIQLLKDNNGRSDQSY